MIAEDERHALIAQGRLGESPGEVPLERREEFRTVAARLAAQADREISIFSHDLDAPVYDQAAFVEAVKALAIGSRMARVRILIRTNERLQREGHRLIELARRLPTKIEIRRVHKDYADCTEDFLVADEAGYVHRKRYTRHEGNADFHAPLQARQYRDFFNTVWDVSERDSELRRLYI
jgi:hypothetical protein